MTDEEHSEFVNESEAKEEPRVESIITFSFYFSLIAIFLFSWLFHLVLWNVLEISSTMYYVYLIGISFIVCSILVASIIVRKKKQGIFGIISNSIILISYLVSLIIYLV